MNIPRIARVVLLALVPPVSALAEPTQPPPVETFFKEPVIRGGELSPSGRHVAFLAPVEGGRLGIALFDVDTGQMRSLVSARDENIDAVVWKSDDRLLFFADVGGNESFATQMVDINTGKITRLFESYGENNYTRQRAMVGGIADLCEYDPDHIVYRGLKEQGSRSFGYYTLNLRTMRTQKVGGISSREEDRVLRIFLNKDRQIVARLVDNRESIDLQHYREGGPKTVRSFSADLFTSSSILSAELMSDNDSLVFIDFDAADRGALVRFSLKDSAVKETIFQPEIGELEGFSLDDDRTAVERVVWYDGKIRRKWLNSGKARLQQLVDRVLPGTNNQFTGISDDEKLILVASLSDRQPVLFSLLDLRRDKPTLMPIGNSRPDLPVDILREVEIVEFPATDGLPLAAYLIRPAAAANGPVPLVVLPHGGPYGIRDSWEFDPEVQFLANRGFAVLQVQFRGSGGRGRAHLEAGRFEWGRKMQEDLADGVRWCIAQGIADPKRVVIYGASYGGYAALWGPIVHPELYRAAINYVGISDMTILGRRDRTGDNSFDDMFYSKWVARSTAEAEAISPVNFVEKIGIPTFHAYGENDPRVEYRHWKKLEAELKKHGKVYEYFNLADEGHGFTNEAGRMGLYERIDAFLNKHVLQPQS